MDKTFKLEMKVNKLNSSIAILFFLSFFICLGQDSSRIITTGVPFLLIAPDARASGMGDVGVATPADAYSQQWNPAKYAFIYTEKVLGLSYTPYLSKLVDDIFLGNITYFSRLNDRSSWATSLKYFSLGDIRFNEFIGGSIVDQGMERPTELTIDLSYALKLSKTFSMAVAGRYIRSDLKIVTDSDTSSANSLGVDIAGFHQSNVFKFGSNNAIFRTGFNISNIGPKLSYDLGGQKNFIPTNFKTGLGLDVLFDSNNILGIYTELNKLLVPSPVAVYDQNNLFLRYSQPDVDFLKGIFTSFNDAPGGVSEELKEITYALGLEYRFQDSFSIRSGFFGESQEKGSRRYVTMGAGFDLKSIDIDISYLFSISNVRNPLENTIRFSLALDIGNSVSISSTEISEE